MFCWSQNPVTALRSVTPTGGVLQVASAQSTLSTVVRVRGSVGLSVLPASVVLNSGADVFRIPEFVMGHLGARLPVSGTGCPRWKAPGTKGSEMVAWLR